MQQLLGEHELRAGVERLKARGPDATRLSADLRGRDPEDGPGLVYEKGAAFLRVLEAHFGRPRFDAFLRAYFERHAFASMTSARLTEILKADLFRGDEAAWNALRVEEWIYGTGLPGNLVAPASDRFAAVRRAADAFAASGALEGVGVRASSAWVTAEWLGFLGALPRDLSAERLGALDARFGLSQSGNAEILSAWLGLCARSAYAPAYAAIERFLTRQGRLKFIMPLYGSLHAQAATRELARRIFEQARPGYHPIAAEAVERLLSRSPRPH